MYRPEPPALCVFNLSVHTANRSGVYPGISIPPSPAHPVQLRRPQKSPPSHLASSHPVLPAISVWSTQIRHRVFIELSDYLVSRSVLDRFLLLDIWHVCLDIAFHSTPSSQLSVMVYHKYMCCIAHPTRSEANRSCSPLYYCNSPSSHTFIVVRYSIESSR